MHLRVQRDRERRRQKVCDHGGALRGGEKTQQPDHSPAGGGWAETSGAWGTPLSGGSRTALLPRARLDENQRVRNLVGGSGRSVALHGGFLGRRSPRSPD